MPGVKSTLLLVMAYGFGLDTSSLVSERVTACQAVKIYFPIWNRATAAPCFDISKTNNKERKERGGRREGGRQGGEEGGGRE